MTLTNVGLGPAGRRNLTPRPSEVALVPHAPETGTKDGERQLPLHDPPTTVSPTIFASITVDTHGPTVHVPAAVTVTLRRDGVDRLSRERQPCRLRTTVTVRVLERAGGKVVKVFTVGKVLDRARCTT